MKAEGRRVSFGCGGRSFCTRGSRRVMVLKMIDVVDSMEFKRTEDEAMTVVGCDCGATRSCRVNQSLHRFRCHAKPFTVNILVHIGWSS